MTRFVRLHPRLLISIAIGIAGFVLAGARHGAVAAAILGWNAGCWSWIAMMGWLMGREEAKGRHQLAGEDEDVGAWFALGFVCVSAVMSIAAIIFELARAHEDPGMNGTVHYVVAAATVAGSWTAVGIAFAMHYAHLYYAGAARARPLRFPEEGGGTPDYWDFLYFSFTLSVAAQTSDVSVLTTDMRKVVVAHCVLGFLFNAAIIGFSINVFAGLVGRQAGG